MSIAVISRRKIAIVARTSGIAKSAFCSPGPWLTDSDNLSQSRVNSSRFIPPTIQVCELSSACQFREIFVAMHLWRRNLEGNRNAIEPSHGRNRPRLYFISPAMRGTNDSGFVVGGTWAELIEKGILDQLGPSVTELHPAVISAATWPQGRRSVVGLSNEFGYRPARSTVVGSGALRAPRASKFRLL
jgi:hypothetical protein